MNNINSKAGTKAGTKASVCGTYVLGCATLKLTLAQSLHDLLFLPLPGRKANKYVTLSPNASLYNFKANSSNIYVEEVYLLTDRLHAGRADRCAPALKRSPRPMYFFKRNKLTFLSVTGTYIYTYIHICVIIKHE